MSKGVYNMILNWNENVIINVDYRENRAVDWYCISLWLWIAAGYAVTDCNCKKIYKKGEQDKWWMAWVGRKERPEWKGNCNKLSNNNNCTVHYTLVDTACEL